jgi:hypothetical protein
MTESLVIPSRFCGPPGIGNGGHGRLADRAAPDPGAFAERVSRP